MRTLPLGDSGLVVSALGLGCMTFGTRTPKIEAFALLDTYWEAGGRFLDTANNYAFWEAGGRGGESETVLGEWLRERGCRDDAIVATKVGALPSVPGGGLEAAEGLGRQTITAAVEASLRRLQIERIDLCYAHIEDRSVPPEETMAAWDDLVAGGKVRAIGCSNHTARRIEAAQSAARLAGGPTYCAVQQRHSYLRPAADTDFGVQRTVTAELRDRCLTVGDMTVVAYSALLGGAYAGGPLHPNYDTSENRVRLHRLRLVSAGLGASPNQVVLAWLLSDALPTIPLVAASSVGRLRESLDAADLRLDAGVRDEL